MKNADENKLIAVYHGFEIHKVTENIFIAKSKDLTLSSSCEHDIYAVVRLHTF